MKSKVSVIVPTFNRKNLLYNCLKCLDNQQGANFETIVVVDGSTDGTFEMLEEHFPKVDVLIGNGDLWWTGSVNLGIQHTLQNLDAEFIILINDDTEFDINYIQILIELAKENENALIGSVSVDIHNPNIITYGGNIINPWLAKSNYINKGKDISNIDPKTIIECSNLIGRGIIIPRKAFDTLGLYDSKRFKHRGDTEFPVRAKNIGFKLLVSYRSIIKMYSNETYGIDIAEAYSINDFYDKFFNFRSSSYIKYRFYYSIIQSKNILQFLCFFTFSMMANVRRFILKLKFIKKITS